MSYAAFDWTIATGAGATVSLETERLSPMLSNTVEAGYLTTAPSYTRDQWLFKVHFKILRASGYIYLNDFFHSHRGGQLFHFRIPVGLFGIPLEFYYADPGGLSPWSSELEIGYGEAPTYLCRFLNQSLAIARREDTVQNYWHTVSPLEIRQV